MLAYSGHMDDFMDLKTGAPSVFSIMVMWCDRVSPSFSWIFAHIC